MPLPKELTTVTSLSKGLALVIFILLPCISFLVGYNYGYELDNISRNFKPNSSQKELSLKDESTSLLDTSGWQAGKITRKVATTVGASGTYTIDFLYPKDWSLKKKVDSNGCGSYILSKQYVGKLTINSSCGGWSAIYYPIPSDSLIVKRIDGITDDGSTYYLIRFLADGNDTYRYADVLSPQNQPINIVRDKMGDKIFFGLNVLDIQLTHNGMNATYQTNYIQAQKIADTILNSFVIEKNGAPGD